MRAVGRGLAPAVGLALGKVTWYRRLRRGLAPALRCHSLSNLLHHIGALNQIHMTETSPNPEVFLDGSGKGFFFKRSPSRFPSRFLSRFPSRILPTIFSPPFSVFPALDMYPAAAVS